MWIVTERVVPLTKRLGPEGQLKDGGSEEWKVWGLSRITVRFAFLYFSDVSRSGERRTERSCFYQLFGRIDAW